MLTAKQWSRIEGFFPKPKRRRDGRGRPPVSNRRCCEGILWVLRNGAPWREMPKRYPSGSTCWRRLRSRVIGQPHPGAQGWLRVSHRELDPERSTPAEPFLTHRREQRLRPKEIVPVEIAIWPYSMLWHAGQQLRLVVAGNYLREPGWFERFGYEVRNRGDHIIHTGGKYDSHILVPRIPA